MVCQNVVSFEDKLNSMLRKTSLITASQTILKSTKANVTAAVYSSFISYNFKWNEITFPALYDLAFTAEHIQN
jgi:hypothetical protein